MKDFFSDIYDWIYLNTGDFDELIFSLPVIIIIGLVLWLLRRSYLKRVLGDKYKSICKKVFLNEIVRLLLAVWVVVVCFMTLIPTGFWNSLWRVFFGGELMDGVSQINFSGWNFVPFIFGFIYEGHIDWFIASARYIVPHYIENMLLYIPLGIAFPIAFKKISFPKVLLAGFGTSLFIEFLQGFFGRDGDIDDLICNTVGTVIGYLLYLIIKKIFPRFIAKCSASVRDETDFIKRAN